jgi:hypothetical protein
MLRRAIQLIVRLPTVQVHPHPHTAPRRILNRIAHSPIREAESAQVNALVC